MKNLILSACLFVSLVSFSPVVYADDESDSEEEPVVENAVSVDISGGKKCAGSPRREAGGRNGIVEWCFYLKNSTRYCAKSPEAAKALHSQKCSGNEEI